MADPSEPAYIRRNHAANHQQLERQARKLERWKFFVELGTGLGIWATVVGTAIAILDTRQATERQLGAMRGQIDAMIAQQRPWISAKPRLKLPLMLSDAKFDPKQQSFDLFVPLEVELQNHGNSPAIDVTIQSMLFALPIAPEILNAKQEELCTTAEQTAKDEKKLGIAVFPGETKPAKGTASTGPVIQPDPPPLHYYMEGCIDYTYNGTLHGKTGYRIELGHANETIHLWEGFKFRIDSREFKPESGSMMLRMNPEGIDYRETDDGGNWAR